MNCFSILVEGKVQGVWYRASAQAEASRLDLSGTIENRKDGSVYIEVKGPINMVNALVEWCKKGPSNAVVKEVAIKKIEEKTFTDFKILRKN